MAAVAGPAIGPSRPSAALPASGSRGLQFHTGLSAIAAPPQYCFSVRIGLAFAKSMVGTSLPVANTETLSRGRCLRCHFRAGVKNAAPLTVGHVPDRANIIVAGDVLTVRCRLDFGFVSNDGSLFIWKHDIEIAQAERFHVCFV